MDTATRTATATTLETLIAQLIAEVVDRIDFQQLKERKLAYSPEEVAELVGFANALAVTREANTGRLLGSKVRGKWRFTEEQIRDYLREHEVPI
jgi:hypothetical protein